MQKTTGLAVLFAALLIMAVGAASGQTENKRFAEGIVSSEGDTRLPENFRTDYVMLGAWSIAGDADIGGEIGLHIVYAPKPAVEAYRKTGVFPDGSVLVKELFNGRTESLTTGEATSAAGKVGTFVMVKDSKGRFPGNPLWGDGWGWSFFSAKDPIQTVTKDYQADCLACHEPARASDLVYIQAYPVLK